MMMMTIKDRKILLGLLFILMLILLFIIRSGEMGTPDGRQPELQIFQLEDGWGYQIVLGRKVMIYQPTVPVIDTVMAFPDEASARNMGELVLKKLYTNNDFSILTQEE
ncbi:MAG: DUF4907 domain-containing protein [Tannerellaceae bacterium]|nr:DUF4907 domain-containing protein [Tannerellaceae bacterium]